MARSGQKALLIMHKKSCTRPEVKDAVNEVRRRGVDLSVRIPWRRKDIRAFLKEAKRNGIERIIAGGGDGTLNKVVNALMRRKEGKDFVLGLMPLGTANDFARGADIPSDDLTAALMLACTAEGRPVDIGRANDDYFANVASGGFGAEVTATTPEDLKRALGGVAYTLMGLAKALDLQPYEGRLILPDGTTEHGRMLIMAVGNNRYAGGGFDVAPRADMTDGLLDLSFLGPLEDWDVASLMDELADPFNQDNKHLNYSQRSSFVIETDRPLNINLDGQPVVANRFEFEAIPAALKMAIG